MANENFRQLTDWNGHEGKWVSQVAFLESGTIGKALNAFLKGEEKARQFEGHDGQAIGGRHFTVRLARLKPTPLSTKRCLVSLIDKTAQVETENNARAERRRDSRTGPPNRPGSTERAQ